MADRLVFSEQQEARSEQKTMEGKAFPETCLQDCYYLKHFPPLRHSTDAQGIPSAQGKRSKMSKTVHQSRKP